MRDKLLEPIRTSVFEVSSLYDNLRVCLKLKFLDLSQMRDKL